MTTNDIPDYPRDVREMALALLRQGRVPVPNYPRTKKPIESEWTSKRPTVEDLDKTFPVGTDRNIGVQLGHASGGLVDIDLDSPEALLAAPFFLPPTGWVSGRKSAPRSHHWYRADGLPFEHASDTFRDTEKTDAVRTMLVEMRTDTFQTIVPPSTHPTGERYGWYAWMEPARIAWADLKKAVSRLATASLLARHWPAIGGRHEARLALAGGLLRGGLPEDAATEFLTAVCTAANNQDIADCSKVVPDTAEKLRAGEEVRGWPSLAKLLTGDGERVVKCALEWLGMGGKKAGRTPDPYRPFPVEALPEPMRSFVVEGAKSIGCDPVYLILPAFAIAGGLIGNTRVVLLKRGWHEPSVIWSCIVGDSGTLKSPAVKAVTGPVYRLQRELIRSHQAKLAEYENEKTAYDERKRKAKKEEKAFDQEPPEKPTLPRVLTSDVTIEKLAELLEENPRGMLVCRDELGGWLSSFNRYRNGGGSDLPQWLETFRAETLIVDRKTGDRPTLYVPRAAVSVLGGIQPGALARNLTPEHLDAGLGARLLLAMPPKMRKRWTEAEIDPDTAAGYEQMLLALHDIPLDRDMHGDKEPFTVRMTADAHSAWVEFYNAWATEQAGVEDELAAAFSKLEAYCARLALIHHVVSRIGNGTDCEPIELESIHAAISIIRWFGYETRRVYATLTESEAERQTRRLLEFIRARGGSITARRLQRASPGKYKTAEEAAAALDGLCQAQLAEWIERPATTKGGRPTRECVLRPDLTKDKTDETPDDDDADEWGGGGAGPTQPPDTTPPTSGIPRDSEGSVSFGFCQPEENRTNSPPDENGVVSGEDEGVVSGEAPEHPDKPNGSRNGQHPDQMTKDKTDTTSQAGYLLVTDAAGLETVRGALEETAVVGLDTETTGLDPRTDRVRLLSLDCDTTDGGRFTYVIDCFAVDLRPLWDTLSTRPIIGHNATFDLQFLAALGFEPAAPLHDTMLLSQLLYGSRKGRGFHGLGQTAERELGRPLDKTEQKSDWSGHLTPEQLTYAAADAAVLLALLNALTAKVNAAGMATAAAVEARCLPGLAWLSRCGAALDRPAWKALASAAQDEVADLAHRMDEEAPERPGRLMRDDAWNWASPQEVAEAFAALGIPLESTDDDALASVQHPLAELLRLHRAASKRTGTYGLAWLKNVASDGRVYANWRQIGADSGRMSCSDPNLQNLPRDARYRRCFIAPPGRVLIKADYSQVELRIAAKLTGDKAMFDAYGRGEDLHTATARLVLGVQDVTKAHRQLAKSLNFGLVYGMGSKAFRIYAHSNYGVALTQEDAERYRRAFFDAYPGLRRWHRSITDGAVNTKTLVGRLRAGVTRFTEKLNTPVQGTGADGLKQALALLWERRADCPDASPVLVVHDEIVVEAAADKADAAKAWLIQAMKDGMAPLISPVPCEVEATVGRTWAGD